jgi:hypothetical protein
MAPGHCKMGRIRISLGARDKGFANGLDGRGEISMKVFNKKASDLKKVEWAQDLFFSTPKVP